VKIIFNAILQSKNGASLLTLRNYLCLTEIFGVNNVFVNAISLECDEGYIKKFNNLTIINAETSQLGKLINLIKFNFPIVSDKFYKNAINIMSLNEINMVFIDDSLFGNLAKKLKSKFDVKIFTCLHDVKVNLYKQIYKQSGIKKLPTYLVTRINESNLIKNSEEIITLNKRESLELNKHYYVNSSAEVPITIGDKLTESSNFKNNKLQLLFVGIAEYYPNLKGIRWFAEQVMPHLDANLRIIGRGMERYADELSASNIEVIGTVDDISSYYMRTNAVIAPIFEGAGMKVKTAEALMYGKFIFGTTEAFEGYEIINGHEGLICDSKEEFISGIKENHNTLMLNSFNQSSRNLYMSSYNDKVALKKFKELFNKYI
jgi:hypothetical protein